FKSHAFVDEIKKITGMDMTIFQGDTRLSTTIQNNGNRATGTQLNNPAVERAVLQGGGTYAAPAKILGTDYRTIYWPIKDSEGRTLGMWFIGESVKDVQAKVDAIAFYCLIATAIIVIVLSILGYIFFYRLVTPLKKAVEYATLVSNGNLDSRLDVKARGDEIGDLVVALQTMVDSLKNKISEANDAMKMAEEKTKLAEEATKKAEEAALEAQNAKREGMQAAAGQLETVVDAISAAASELSAQIEESDRGANESSSRLGEAATAMNEMNATVQEVARNASSAASVSGETRRNAEDGQKILADAMQSISNVRKVSLELQEDMGELHGHTQNIAQIMSVITDIADQTNLLALNAAIEAARAGEAGRGFAVVADEVRKLAEKTMASTNDVSKAITSIQNSAQMSVDKMAEALDAVEKANNLAQQSGEALGQIVQNVEETADQVRAIAAAAEEQSAASDEINQSVVTVNEMSSQTAQAMNEAAQAISDLAQQTESLSALVEHMKQG
nr:cache domain-containing protein [Desulfovibrio sp.]